MLVSASTNPPKTLEEMYRYIRRMSISKADYIHCDVMDGKFVRAHTFNYKVVKVIKGITSLPLDVHLMTATPKIKEYIEAGADILTVHYESFKDKKALILALKNIRKGKAKAGLSIKPKTDIDEILPYVKYCDVILVMSVNPGKSGQKFLPSTYDRIKNLRKFIALHNLHVIIEVDGGVNYNIASKLSKCGVSMIVCGSYLYKSRDPKIDISNLHRL